MKWNHQTNNFIYLNDSQTGYCRLDRVGMNFNNQTINRIKSGAYSDYHLLRPYSQYIRINEEIYNLL